MDYAFWSIILAFVVGFFYFFFGFSRGKNYLGLFGAGLVLVSVLGGFWYMSAALSAPSTTNIEAITYVMAFLFIKNSPERSRTG